MVSGGRLIRVRRRERHLRVSYSARTPILTDYGSLCVCLAPGSERICT